MTKMKKYKPLLKEKQWTVDDLFDPNWKGSPKEKKKISKGKNKYKIINKTDIKLTKNYVNGDTIEKAINFLENEFSSMPWIEFYAKNGNIIMANK